MRRWANAGLLLAHRLRRWPNSKPTLAQRLMFAGLPLVLYVGLFPCFCLFYCSGLIIILSVKIASVVFTYCILDAVLETMDYLTKLLFCINRLQSALLDDHCAAIMRRWNMVGLLLGQRRRRWANSKPTLSQRLVGDNMLHLPIRSGRSAVGLLHSHIGRLSAYLQ